MFRWKRTRIARAVAAEMARQQEMATMEQLSRGTFTVDIGGYTVTTITGSRRGMRVSHELHPKVAQRQVPTDAALLVDAERAFTKALLAVMKAELNLREA